MQNGGVVAEVIRHPIKKAARQPEEHIKFFWLTSRFFDWVPDDFSNNAPVLQWVTRYYVLSLCEEQKAAMMKKTARIYTVKKAAQLHGEYTKENTALIKKCSAHLHGECLRGECAIKIKFLN